MKIITDTREQRNQHILETISNKNIPFKVKKLEFGDYSIAGHETQIVVERKKNLTELANCFCSGRARFANEFERAKEAQVKKIVLLIEDEKGREKILYRQELDKNPELTAHERQKKTWRSNFRANSMIGSITSWRDKYNFDIVFCSKRNTGKIIVEIFEEYLKNIENEGSVENADNNNDSTGIETAVQCAATETLES